MSEADRGRVRIGTADGSPYAAAGVLIAPRIVLTSADACPPGAAPTVTPAGSDHRYAAERIWPRSGAESAVALLEIIDHEWVNSAFVTRWGVLTSSDQWITSEVDGDHPVAIEINNSATLPDGSRECRPALTDQLPAGTAVYSGQILVGVLARPGEPGRRPLVRPVAPLLADEDFRAIVDQAAGRRIRVEPVELAGTIRRWRPDLDASRAATLLLPEHEVVPLHGRELLTHQILQWCAERRPSSAALLVGPAGQGKRRLARHVADSLRDTGWAVGELADRPAEDWLEGVAHSRMPVFLIADADRHLPAITALARTVLPTGGRVRVLLLAADPSLPPDPALDILFEDRVHRLDPIAADAEAMAQRLTEATVAFGGLLSLPPEPWLPGPDGWLVAGARRYATTPDAGDALQLHVAALASLLTGAPDDRRSAVGVLLDEEEFRWRQATETLPADAKTSWSAALAAALLFGAADEATAVQTLRMTMRGVAESAIGETAAWIRGLYPPDDADGTFWGTLRPRPLLLEHIAQSWTGSSLLEAMLPSVEPEQARRALSLLLATEDAALLDRVAKLAGDRVRELGPALIEAAYAQPAALTIVERIVDDPDSDLTDDLCRTLLDRVPPTAGPLAEVARRLHERLIAAYEVAVEEGQDRVRPALAAQLAAYAVLRSEVGSATAAADLAGRAVEQYQWLVESGDRGAGYVISLAESRQLYARLQAGAGRPIAAADLAGQAAGVYRTLAEATGTHGRPELADALTTQAAYAVQAGDLPGAEAALREAVGVLDVLVDGESTADARFDLSGRLVDAASQLAEVLWDDGQATASLAAREDAVRAAQRMYAVEPATARPLLIDCLDAVARAQLQLRGAEAALDALRRSLRLCREAAEADPATQLPALASAAMALSVRLSEAGQPAAALDAATEAIEALAQANKAAPGSVLAELALAQHTLSLRLAEAGRWREAAHSADQALTAYTRALHDGRTELRTEFAAALVNRAAIHATRDQHTEAAQIAQQAIGLLSTQSAPGRPGDGGAANRILAAAYTNAAVALSHLGRRDESLTLVSRAVETDPADIPATDQVRALSLHRDLLMGANRPKDAADVAARIVVLYDQFGPREPDVYRGPYAVALHEAARCFAAFRNWDTAIAYARRATTEYAADQRPARPWLDERTAVAMLLCTCYAETNRGAEAAAAAERAVALHREATGDGDARDPADLADTLDAVADLPTDALGRDLARSYAEQAVAHRRPVAMGGNPEQMRKLVRALRRSAKRQAEAAGAEEALPAAQESVAQARLLKEFSRVDGMAEIAVCLRDLSEYLASSGREAASRDAAADAAREAADEYRLLAADDPARYLTEYAGALLDLSHRQARLDAWTDALLSAEAAAEALERVPPATVADRARLGQILLQAALCLNELHQKERQYEVTLRLVGLYDSMARDDRRYQHDHAVALRNLAEVRAGRKTLPDRRDAARQAVELHRILAERDSVRYDAELKASRRTLETLRR
ncbi:hypothetical protein HDA40_001538 [Hamadaea flava]|uniref:Tetratricopeptide repeat protein n=1 Tax=Hamadaea flava TaxID=1742688 RepID=A0ABV8LPQ9_9ACTN|nr:hypothetical protein [Hamadaea flava]MCP2323031.1 hypothetical protein [Hamadaea flava]